MKHRTPSYQNYNNQLINENNNNNHNNRNNNPTSNNLFTQNLFKYLKYSETSNLQSQNSVPQKFNNFLGLELEINLSYRD